ncbi:MAG TPA: multifunctional oxoglutarate decarboxylase/oxoglutarate dehydrogenase thiamine pyrophosphate-binding subunit/dihydrolipoyllysine-residue succinyltransferase subunit, partial [Candidatus Limnocylindria bacterium]|nr:multifunctional oxoglutarate decarboxylase/oxoglutarate dehydrogenase thiamine pyrophosphate-binding subunit/dihydrolipoyllysine-residue succinyltransferase subunit [Candidatus Limnocylindria bacterium]
MPPPSDPDHLTDELNPVNAGYVADLYDRYRADPTSVDAEWRARFDAGFAGFEPVKAAPAPTNGNTDAAAAPAPAAAPASTPPAAAAEPRLPEGATPIKGPAAALARNMTASLAIPTATSFRELDVRVLEERRRELNAQVKPRKISFTHLIGYAIVRAAMAQPSMTHYYLDGADGAPASRVDPGGVNLGLAVDVERPDGSRFLVVPVIKNADGMDFAQFLARYEELVDKARSNKLSMDDMTGATITLTNPGTLGTAASVPRLMPKQGTIVATGTIRGVGEQRLMTISSTYDHRIIQGAESGIFLRTVDASLRGDDTFYPDVFGALKVSIPPSVPAPPPAAATASAEPAAYDDLKAVAAGMALVKAYRHFGHMAARLDPLGAEPPGDPALDPAPLGLNEENMARIPAELMRIYVPGTTLAEALPHLHATYCGTIAYEVEHIASHEQRVWLRHVIESGEHRPQMDDEARKQLLARLTRIDGLERFLHKAYLGQKRFSIEGLDAIVPMLDLIIRDVAVTGARDVVIGMAHRGRLNVLRHIVGVSLEAILSEFEAGKATDPLAPKGGLDDVKYHLGAEGQVTTADGQVVHVALNPNPSHLEAVNPVVEGRARARQTDRSTPVASVDHARVLPVLLHGDAAFAAQGVVAETFNLSRLAGYATGGTIHLITNNQVGFTTGPDEGRSTDYSSDLAKGFDAPIIHVNADDPEACLAAARLAVMYRERFRNDVVIDLVGYRRYGHNEGDEPAYTQPLMAAAIAAHPPARDLYRDQLVAAGVVTAEDAAADAKAVAKELSAAQSSLRKREPEDELDRGDEALAREEAAEPVTSVSQDVLAALNAQLYRWPKSFSVN